MHTLTAKAQAQLIKDFQMEKLKARAPKSTPRFSNPEPSTKARREKKKDRRWRDQQDWQGQKSFTPATGVNAAEPGEANKKKNDDRNRNCLSKAAYDLNQIKCYNYQKIGYYTNKCPKLSKN